MEGVTLPLIVAEGLDVVVYQSFKEAETSLEAVDVRSSEYRVYDATGRAVALSVREARVPFVFGVEASRDMVQITGVEEAPRHAAELRNLLLEHIRALVGASSFSASGIEQLPLEALVMELVRMHARHSKRS